jgi:membrane associated rhomboid family serine protease
MLPVATNLRIIKMPWATYSIAGVNIAVHLLATWNTHFVISERVAGTFGFVPASISNVNLLVIPTIVTSMFCTVTCFT